MDERGHERVVVDKKVQCFFGERQHEVLLYDLSVSGCMIEAPGCPLWVGASIHFKLNNFIEAGGRVVWAACGNAGVQFVPYINEAAVRYLGFTPTCIHFGSMEPRDRFGRLLPVQRWR